MVNLQGSDIESWLAVLPDDIRSGVGDIDAAGGLSDDLASAFVKDLGSDPTPEEVLATVEQHQDSILAMGRARRVRFLAWFASRTYPDHAGAFGILSEEDSDDGGGVLGKVAPVFAQDIRAIIEAVGPRAARLMVDADTLAAVTGAGYEVASEMDMRQGGGAI